MRNKGFTLVELLAVVTLLSLLTGMVVFQASGTIKKANETHYKNQEKFMILAAKEYFLDYRSLLPKTVGEQKEVLLATLEDELYLDPVLDVQKKECDALKSKVIVTMKEKDKYTYEAYLSCPQSDYQTLIS